MIMSWVAPGLTPKYEHCKVIVHMSTHLLSMNSLLEDTEYYFGLGGIRPIRSHVLSKTNDK